MLPRIFQSNADMHRPQLLRRPYSSPTADQTPILITISSEKSKTLSESMNLNFVPSSLLAAMSFPATARGLGSLAVRAFSGKHARHAAFIAFYRKWRTTQSIIRRFNLKFDNLITHLIL